MAIKLFILDKDNNIVINKVEILIYPNFNKIIRRDRGSKGDTQGRLKLQAFRELAYIYFTSDTMSVPNRNGYSDDEARKYAIEHSELDKDYKPDKEVLGAIDIYKKEQSNIGSDVIAELLKTFTLTKTVMRRVRQSLEKKLAIDAFNNDVAVEVLALIETTIKYGRDIPELTRELNKALMEVQVSIDNVELMRGNKLPIPDSAIPGKDW